jgi:hypothetical protein
MGKTDVLYILHTVYVHDYLKILTTKIKTFTNMVLKTARKRLLSNARI